MDLVLDSLVVFGRPSLGASIGLLFGTLTQGRRHVRWSLAWFVAGYLAGVAFLWPAGWKIVVALALFVPIPLWTFFGLLIGAATLNDREDWYLRLWGWIGFIVCFHLAAIGGMALIEMLE